MAYTYQQASYHSDHRLEVVEDHNRDKLCPAQEGSDLGSQKEAEEENGLYHPREEVPSESRRIHAPESQEEEGSPDILVEREVYDNLDQEVEGSHTYCHEVELGEENRPVEADSGNVHSHAEYGQSREGRNLVFDDL